MAENNKKKTQAKEQQTVFQEWTEDKERLILFADFMGFKNYVLNGEHKVIKEKLILFHETFSKKTSPLAKHLQFVQFSDSILITVNGIDKKMFKLLSKAAIHLMHTAMDMGFPIKGVIAQGVFSCDKNSELYFGKPLIDAYLLHEEIKYYGIAVHHSAEKTIKKHRDVKNPYSNTEIYLEKGRGKHYHLCWNLINSQLESKNITQQCEKWIEKIAEHVSGYPRLYVDHTLEVLKADQEWFNEQKKEESQQTIQSK